MNSNHYKFTGDERDAETSLDHTQFRQYTSSLARWMTPDPAGLAAVDPTNPQSWNRYAYVLNNPLNFIDPSGMGPGLCDVHVWDDPGCFGGIGGSEFGGIDDGGLPVGGGDPPLDANAGPGIDGTGLSLIQSSDGSSYFSNLIPGFVPTSVDSGLSQTGTLGADSSLGGDLLPNGDVSQGVLSDLRGNNSGGSMLNDPVNVLAHALNKTGVQSLGNPCTVAAFYGTSAGFAAFGAAAIPGTEANAAVNEALAPHLPLIRYLLRQPIVSRAAMFVAKTFGNVADAAQSGCNALQ